MNGMTKQLAAEFIGTFTLVTAVCGAALFSAPSAGLIAVAFAVGLSVLAMAYAVGGISGGHFNPAVTLGLVAAGRFDAAKVPAYIVAQVLGGAAAACVFYVSSAARPPAESGTRSRRPPIFTAAQGIHPLAVGLIEIVITALFLIVIVGATTPRTPPGFAPIAIGLALVLFHLVAIPVSNASLNPARSTATAIFGGATRSVAVAVLGRADRRRRHRRLRRRSGCRKRRPSERIQSPTAGAMIAAVIGAGPAGLMAAEVLARRRRARDGLRPHAVGGPEIPDGRARRAEPDAQRRARAVSGALRRRRRTRCAPPSRRFRRTRCARGAERSDSRPTSDRAGGCFRVAMKASPLLRAWLRRLDAAGVTLALRHRWTGWDDATAADIRRAGRRSHGRGRRDGAGAGRRELAAARLGRRMGCDALDACRRRRLAAQAGQLRISGRLVGASSSVLPDSP